MLLLYPILLHVKGYIFPPAFHFFVFGDKYPWEKWKKETPRKWENKTSGQGLRGFQIVTGPQTPVSDLCKQRFRMIEGDIDTDITLLAMKRVHLANHKDEIEEDGYWSWARRLKLPARTGVKEDRKNSRNIIWPISSPLPCPRKWIYITYRKEIPFDKILSQWKGGTKSTLYGIEWTESVMILCNLWGCNVNFQYFCGGHSPHPPLVCAQTPLEPLSCYGGHS